MILFKTGTDNALTVVNEKPFRLERDMQKIFERNLPVIMGLELVKSECSIKNKRIDTLAYDPQSNAFVIIEYKRNRNISVFDQGITYLNLMLQYKEVFLVEYNESLGRNLKRSDVDWSQTRVVFVSTDFTENQIEATNFRDLSIELWQVKRYENGTMAVIPIKKAIRLKVSGNWPVKTIRRLERWPKKSKLIRNRICYRENRMRLLNFTNASRRRY